MVAAGAAVAAVLSTRTSSPRLTWIDAPTVSGPPVVPTGGLTAYRVIYRVDAGNPLGSSLSTETLSVLRPWGSRLTTRSGPPPGGTVTEELTSDVGKLRIQPSGGVTSVLVLPVDIAASDLRLDVDAPGLQTAGLAQWAERRRIGGRDCQVLLTTAPPQGQTLARLPAANGDRVETCIDSDGLILEQLRFSGPSLLLRRRAVTVESAPSLDPKDFSITEASTTPVAQGGGNITTVDPSTLPPGPSWFLDSPPSGFVYQGHFAVAEQSPPDANGLANPNRKAGFTDVWRRGNDVIVLDQGGTLFGAAPFGPADGSRPVDLGGLGAGEAIPGTRMSTVRVAQPGGRYVRLAGTLPVEQLVTLARTLRRADRPA